MCRLMAASSDLLKLPENDVFVAWIDIIFLDIMMDVLE